MTSHTSESQLNSSPRVLFIPPDILIGMDRNEETISMLLVRHAEAEANKKREKGDVAFGNFESPLTHKALSQQAPDARRELIETHNFTPKDFEKAVLASEYLRTGDTARAMGFETIHTLELLNESDIYQKRKLRGVDVIKKHVEEDGWLPRKERKRGRKILKMIKRGELNEYGVIFSHGMVIAGILSELNRQSGFEVIKPDPKRGLVPLQAQIIKIEVKPGKS